MIGRRIDLCFPRPGKRRPIRFRAVVEGLDQRRLMAFGTTGVTVAVTGAAGIPLASPGSSPLAPSEPITLVTYTSPLITTQSATGYTATIDWGDGSAVDAAQFGTYVGVPYEDYLPTSGVLSVSGPDHTYQAAGTYTITIAVTGPGDTAPTVYHDTATIVPFAITGQLNPASDSGLSATDEITAINTPNFFGTTQPGASVVLTATNAADLAQNFVVGTGVADAAGNWNITTAPLNDGQYIIAATAVLNSVPEVGTFLAGPTLGRDLTIDAGGPVVASFHVTNARTGTFEITYSDPYGLAVGSLTTPADYVLTRTSPKPRRGQTFAVTKLVDSYGTAGTDGAAFNSVPVTGTLTSGQRPITQNGTYTLTVHAAGITSLSGALLDGDFTGGFRSTGQPGTDFKIKFTLRNGKASAPVAIASVPTTPHAGLVNTQARHPLGRIRN